VLRSRVELDQRVGELLADSEANVNVASPHRSLSR
jgi:hypothetical protein